MSCLILRMVAAIGWSAGLADEADGEVTRKVAMMWGQSRSGSGSVFTEGDVSPFSRGEDRCKAGVLADHAGSGVVIHPPSPHKVVVHVAGPRWPGF